MNETTIPIDIAQHVHEFRELGYTIFPRLFGDDFVSTCRAALPHLQEEIGFTGDRFRHAAVHAVTNLVERAPTLAFPAAAHPVLLGFLEKLIGPFVQLDSTALIGYAPRSEEFRNSVFSWHRDRFALFPLYKDVYFRPTTTMALCYLQDMTLDYGPLRVIPGSHRSPVALTSEEQYSPHPDERLLRLEAGQITVLHNSLLHSATHNVASDTRYFFGIAYNHTYMKQEDNFVGPNCRALLRQAKKANNRRHMRLLGCDEDLDTRLNTGFLRPDEEIWSEWQQAERKALQS